MAFASCYAVESNPKTTFEPATCLEFFHGASETEQDRFTP